MASLTSVKLKAYTQVLTANDKLMNALLVFLGALSLFLAIPFYPFVLAPLLALIPGFIAYNDPKIGVIVSTIMALFAFAYQSTVFAWIWLLATAIVLFKVWDFWNIIAALQILIFLPFIPFPFSLISGFVYAAMLIISYKVGSKKSLLISIPSVLLILLLSALWQVDNSAYFPVIHNIYFTDSNIMRKEFPSIFDFGDAFETSLSNLTNLRNALDFGPALGTMFEDLIRLLFVDTGFLQLLIWAVVLYLPPFITGRIIKGGKKVELYASLSLLFVPIAYIFVYSLAGLDYRIEMPVYALASIGLIYFLENWGINLSRELEIRKRKETEEIGLPGVIELTLSAGEKGLEDVANYEDVKKELVESILTPLQKPEIAYAYGIKPPRGILLFGPPGTGKTMIMRAFAKEIDYRIYYVKCSELLSSLYGESEKKFAELFKKARKEAPVILFFDEIDAIAKKRTLSTTDDVTPRILTTILQELDGFRDDKPVIFVAATNVPQLLDPALLRPGRIDKIIYMGPPDYEGRKKIFKIYIKRVPHARIDYDRLAELTERYTGADIANVVKEATRIAAERAKKSGRIEPITMKDLEEVIRNSKPSVTLSQIEEYEKFKLDFERRMGKPQRKEKRKVLTFKDVADMEEVKKALKEAIELPIKYEHLVKEFDIKPPKGILLFGPPGTGKTYIVKASAGEFGVPLILLSGAELLEKGFEHAAEIIKSEFNRARENAPAIIFIDEIETVAPARTGVNPLMGQLLQELDGVRGLDKVVVIGATNLPYMLDKALLRPGRFDKIIYVGPPSKEVRKEIFRIHLGKFAELFDLDKLAEATEGFSGADIASIVREMKLALMEVKMGKRKKFETANALKLIKKRKPSITKSMLEEYERFLEEFGERK